MTLPIDKYLASGTAALRAWTDEQKTERVDGPPPGLALEVMDQIPYPMAMMSTSGEMLFVNRSIVKLLGYPDVRSLRDTPIEEVVARPEVFSQLQGVMERNGVAHGYEIELIRYNGKSIWLIATVDEVVGVDGPCWQAALIDITDRKLAERADAESRDRYQTVFEQSPVALWEEDFSALEGWFDGLRAAGVQDLRSHLSNCPDDAAQALSLVRVVDVNPAGVALAGADNKEQVLGALSPPESDILCFIEEAVAIWDGHTEFHTEVSGQTRDGRNVTHTVHMAVPTIDGQSDLSRVMVAVHDVTARVEAEQARHDAEKQFQQAFNGAPIGMVLTELTGEMKEVNRAFCDLVGQPALELIGSNWRGLLRPDDFETLEPRLAAFRAGETDSIDTEMRFERGDGTFASASVRASIVRDLSGSPTSVISQFVNTTELHRSHAALTRLFDTLPAALYRTTPDGRLLQANPALLDLLGYPDLKAAQAAAVSTRYVDSTVRDRFESLMEEHGVVMGLEHELSNASGDTIWVNDSAKRMRDDVTQEVYYEGTLIDVTKQKRALLELQASEEWRRNVFYRSPVALFEEDFSKVHAWVEALRATGVTDIRAYLEEHHDEVFEAIGRIEIVAANPAAALLLEADSTDQLLGPVGMKMASRAEESFVEQVVALADGRDRLFLEATGHTFGGRSIDVALMWVLSPGEDQVDSHRVLVAVVDETERREVERHLRELVRTKDEIIASVSHELRTPLTVVLGFAQEMRDNWDHMASTERRDFVDAIATQAGEASNIVDDLLTAARLDVDRLTVALSSVDLLDQAHQTIADVNSRDQYALAIQGDSAMAWADKARVRQILRNLVTNSRRHGGPNLEVRTSSDHVHATVTVTVRDDGAGIAPADIERAFQRYERIHDTATQPASIGLGLHLSRGLAHLMGGDISYAYVDGWTEFSLTLPAAPQDEPLNHSHDRRTK